MIYLKIKKIREQSNITREYIAIQMEISIKNYIEIEKGNIDLRLSKLKQLSDLLGVLRSDFFD